jgi:AcrR family transcriptional regulator
MQTKTGSISKGERTRRVILDTAYALFIKQGFSATSMRQIAQGSGVALGGIYNHFSSKEEIFDSIILEKHLFLQVMPALKETRADTIEEFVHQAARDLVNQLGGHPEFLNLMLIEVVEFKGAHSLKVFSKILPEILSVGERLGEFEDEIIDIPPALFMRAFMGLFISYFITEVILGDLMPPEMSENSLDKFIDIFLHGIEKKNRE